MRFSIEQMFLSDSSGKPLGQPPPMAYHVVEAETVETALSLFLTEQQAKIVGDIQRFPGAQAVVTAQQGGTVFTLHLAPGTGSFRRARRSVAVDTEGPADSSRDSGQRR